MVIHYRINPTGPTAPISNLTSSKVIEAIRAGAATWMAADPQVDLVYDGTTSDPAVGGIHNLGFNSVVGFVPLPPNVEAETSFTNDASGFITSFSMGFNLTMSWTWTPCDPARGQPCDPVPLQNLSLTANGPDLQDVATHEWGHALGLGHAQQSDDYELAMYPLCVPATPGICRNQDTLGLGDVLGVRHLYPTSASMPVLYRP